MEEDARRKSLVPGKRYRVKLSDCCIEGELVGTFLDRIYYEEDGKRYIDSYLFSFGTIGPDWGQWDTEEMEGV